MLFNGACADAEPFRGGGTSPRRKDGGAASKCAWRGPSGLATSGVLGDDLAKTAVVGRKSEAITTRWFRNELIVGGDEQNYPVCRCLRVRDEREREKERGGPVDIWPSSERSYESGQKQARRRQYLRF